MTHIHQNYYGGHTYKIGMTNSFLHKAKSLVTENQDELFIPSPYGEDGPQLVLSHAKTRKLLEHGFVDSWNRRWRLINFDGGTKPYVLKFRVKRTLKSSIRHTFKRFIHPLTP